jgi:hypothetical protein
MAAQMADWTVALWVVCSVSLWAAMKAVYWAEKRV